ncbi:MAG: mandelate racemase/muconate lactonizing enzyme family protein [Bryobacterales bacterium]|nr:mandelate racemase/muconate lactonizing enzyme family protein [Bryobacterales bacterium]
MPTAPLSRRLRLAPQPVPFATGPNSIVAGRHWRTARYSIVRLQTRSGVTGYGECAPIEQAQFDAAMALIKDREATSFEVVRTIVSGPMEAAMNTALLDISGKIAKAPVYQLLGGPTRTKVRAMATLSAPDPRAMEALREQGYLAFRVPVNKDNALAVLKELRAAAGDSVDFVLDGAGKLSPAQASSLAAAVERFHPLWIDEPCPLDNVRAVSKISDENVTPLGFGRHALRPIEFQELLREQVIDVLRPDLARMGISSIRRAAAIAETYYTAVAPYNIGGRIATAAGLHLAASIPNFYLLDIPPGTATVKDGFAELPTAPGLGITINEGEWN